MVDIAIVNEVHIYIYTYWGTVYIYIYICKCIVNIGYLCNEIYRYIESGIWQVYIENMWYMVYGVYM